MSTEAPTKSVFEGDYDPQETAEWIESLRYVLDAKGADRVRFLLRS